MIRFYKDEFRKNQHFRKKQYSQSLRKTKNKKIRKRGSLDNDLNNTNNNIGEISLLSQARKIKSSENLTTDAFGFEFYYMKKAREKRDALYAQRRADLHAKL